MSCGAHLSSGNQDPGQQRCCNGPLQSMHTPPSLLSGPGNRKRILCSFEVTEWKFTFRWVHLALIGPDCHCVLCSCEQGTGRGRTVYRFLRVFVKASCSTHQAEASGGSVSRKQEQGHPSWSAGAKPRNLCQQHCLRVALSCQQ